MNKLYRLTSALFFLSFFLPFFRNCEKHKEDLASIETIDTLAVLEEVDTLLVKDSISNQNSPLTNIQTDDQKENMEDSITESQDVLSKTDADTLVHSDTLANGVNKTGKSGEKIDIFYQKLFNKIGYRNSNKQDITGISLVIISVISIYEMHFDVLFSFLLLTFLSGGFSIFLSMDKKRNILLVINILQISTLLYTYKIMEFFIEKALYGYWIALSLSILNLLLVISSKLKLYFQSR